jgi:hypothetical protein
VAHTIGFALGYPRTFVQSALAAFHLVTTNIAFNILETPLFISVTLAMSLQAALTSISGIREMGKFERGCGPIENSLVAVTPLPLMTLENSPLAVLAFPPLTLA